MESCLLSRSNSIGSCRCLLRQEPDEEEDEGDGNDNDDEDDDGYSE
jgi:hypothetical protein